MKLWFSSVLFLMLHFAAYAQASAPHDAGGPRTSISPAVESKIDAHKNLVYAKYGERALQLDLYRPKFLGERKRPAIVCIHGGGWWQGKRESQTNVAKAFAARGYVAATITYRLSGEATFPAQIHDCKAAVRFLRANADKYGIDANNIGATGLSAGGHLVTLLATSAKVEALEGNGGHAQFSSRIQAAVPMGAQSNLRRHHDNVENSDPKPAGPKPNIWIQFLGGKPSEQPERWRLASPMTHLNRMDCPILFVAGENDNPTTRAEEFRVKMKKFGIAQGVTVINDAPHAFLGRQKFFDQMLDSSAAWFDQHLATPRP